MIVEDGTGLPDADSYASVEDADAFHLARRTVEWIDSSDDDAKAAALIAATDYLDATYRFRGDPLSVDQALSSPRLGDTRLHPLIAKATMTLAARFLSGTVSATIAGREVLSDEKTVGPVSTKVTYAADRPSDPFPDVSGMLRPLTLSGSWSIGQFIR